MYDRMELNKRLNRSKIIIIIFTIATVLLVGLITSRLLTSSWNAYVHDVGIYGAFIVLAIFHLIYAGAISIGVIFFIVNLSIHSDYPKIHTCIISSAVTIVFADVLGAFYWSIGWLEIIIGLPIMTWLICKLLHFLERWMEPEK